MVDGALGVMMAIGPFVLVVTLIYAVLHFRHRSRTLERQAGARPSSPTPNDIT